MILRRKIDNRYLDWNHKWGAPYGKSLPHFCPPWLRKTYLGMRFCGPFAFQVNNDTRIIEYPWAFYVTTLSAGMKVLEVGGGLSGFQFVLSRQGIHVDNIDPGMENMEWPVSQKMIDKLNRAFGTHVCLYQCGIQDIDLKHNYYDKVFSISVLEHLPDNIISSAIEKIYNCLKPGGIFVLTVDLFLDIIPFTDKSMNIYGKNIPLNSVADSNLFELVHGDISELYGFEEFNPKVILTNLPIYFIGSIYPALIQTVVLKKRR